MNEVGVIYLLEVFAQKLQELPPDTLLSAEVLRKVIVKVVEQITES
jgi:hypothetical protein